MVCAAFALAHITYQCFISSETNHQRTKSEKIRMGYIVSLKPEFGLNKPDDGGKKLEACPFCASTPHIEQDQDETWYVACVNKRCLVLPITRPFMTRIQAVRAWNGRVKF